MRKILTAFLVQPLLHFLLIGGLLFAVKIATSDWRALGIGRETITITAADVETFRNEWARETKRFPDPQELQAGVRKIADDETLFREALRLGLNQSDPVVHSRLVQNMHFAYPDSALDEAGIFKEALALGMDQRDVVAHRRLIQAMERRIVQQTRLSDSDVRAFVAQHPERYAGPRRIRFRQIFLSADQRGKNLEADVQKLQTQLTDQPSKKTSSASIAGDAFLLGRDFPLSSAADIARNFGSEFSQAMQQVPANTWSGPIRSIYGLHFVWVDEIETAQAADFAAVRKQAYYALLEEREKQTLRDELIALRWHYPVKIEWPQLAMGTLP